MALPKLSTNCPSNLVDADGQSLAIKLTASSPPTDVADDGSYRVWWLVDHPTTPPTSPVSISPPRPASPVLSREPVKRSDVSTSAKSNATTDTTPAGGKTSDGNATTAGKLITNTIAAMEATKKKRMANANTNAAAKAGTNGMTDRTAKSTAAKKAATNNLPLLSPLPLPPAPPPTPEEPGWTFVAGPPGTDSASGAEREARETDEFPLVMPTVYVLGARRDWRAEEAERRARRREQRVDQQTERGYVVVKAVEAGEE